MKFQQLAFVPAVLLAIAGSPLAAQPELRSGLPVAEAHELIESVRSTNAALVYYRTWMTANPDLNKVHLALEIAEGDDNPTSFTPAEAEQILIDSRDVIENYIAAAALDQCDFGIAYQDGWNALLPHLGKLRATTRVLRVDAKRLLKADDIEAAGERVAAIYGMAWQVKGDRVLISSLVGLAIANSGHELAIELVDSGELSEQGRDLLIARLERFEGADDPFAVRASIAMEAAMTIGWLDELIGDGRLGDRLLDDGLLVSDNAGTLAELNALDAEGVRRESARMGEYYKQVVGAWDKEDAIERIEALAAIVEAGGFGPLAKSFGASLGRARAGEQHGMGELADTLDVLRAYRPTKHDEDGPENAGDETEPARKR
jgi:hypothetical protein